MSEYSIRIKRDHCEPCKGHHSKEQQLQPDECPIFKNDTYIIMTQLGRKLNEIRRQLSSDEEKLFFQMNQVEADKGLRPYMISDLEDIENSGLGKHLRRKTQPERVLHYSFARVNLITSYLDEALEMIADKYPEFRHNITYSINNLHEISCKVFDFTAMLSVSKIKKKVCVYEKNVTFDKEGHDTDYAISIFKYSKNILERVYKDLEGLEEAPCTYDCSGKKRKLQCVPEARALRSGERKKKKEKKQNKNKGKGKKNKGNKKERKEREKRKDTVSQQSKIERRRQKNRDNNSSQNVLH